MATDAGIECVAPISASHLARSKEEDDCQPSCASASWRVSRRLESAPRLAWAATSLGYRYEPQFFIRNTPALRAWLTTASHSQAELS